MILHSVNVDPLNPLVGVKPNRPDFNGAWLWGIAIIAALFIGYLCFDAWRVRQRNKRINKLREKAKQAQEANPS